MIYSDYSAFKTAIESCGITAAEAEFKKSTNTPYLCYFRSNERTIDVDGKPAYVITNMSVELYTAKSDVTTEATFEAWLRSQGINAEKTERAFVQSESYYETVYEFEVVFR